MAAFGGSVFEKKHVAKFCHYYILKLYPNVSYNDAMDFIFAKGTKKRSGGGITSLKMVVCCSVVKSKPLHQ